MKAVFRKHLNSLHPMGSVAEEVLRKIKHDDLVTVEVKRERNLAHHQKFFSMLQLIYENQDHYQSVDDILTAFKFCTGHTDKVMTRGGRVLEYPKSISFASMPQDEFEVFYNRALVSAVTSLFAKRRQRVERYRKRPRLNPLGGEFVN